MKRLIVLLGGLGVLAVAAGVGGFLWLEGLVSTPANPEGADVTFAVPKGATARGLGQPLIDAGLVKSPLAWRYFLWKRGGLNAKAGKHVVSGKLTLDALAKALEAAPLVEDEPFIVVEGWRLRDTDKALAEKGWARPGDYVKAASRPDSYKAPFALPTTTLEGYLYPETYRFPVGGFTVEALVQKQLDTFAERFWVPQQGAIAQSGRTLEQLVIMASLLEREEPTPRQRATVAGILWKRFDKKTPLGVDATSRYELEEWNDRKAFLKKLRDENDPWNTRTRAGLPPGPLGATTLDSLHAALNPEKNPYWYYLHDSNKQLHPSKNAEEHEALRAKYNVY